MSLQGNIAVEVEMKKLLKVVEDRQKKEFTEEEILYDLLWEIKNTIRAAESGWL